MYRVYLVPDATQYANRAAMYQAKLLLWDPRSESDAYAAIGQKEKGELNKADSFELTILPANIRYNDVHKKISVIIVYDDDEWIFEGVVSDCPVDFYKQKKITCSGPLSYLCDSVQAPDEKNQVEIPTASGNTYVQVPNQWYNNANPHDQGWQERSSKPNDEGNYVYTLTSDTKPKKNKTYWYISSGDNQNHSGSTITKKVATKETISNHLDRLLEVHNSQVDYFKKIYLGNVVGDSEEHEFKSSNYRQTWSAIKSDIIEQYGRYITVRMDNNYTLRLNYLELNDMDPHSTPEASIVFAENMMEMSESDDSDDDIFTVLVPIGKNNLTIADLSGHTTPEHGDNRMVDPYAPSGSSWGGNRRYIVVSHRAVEMYGYIVKTQTFSDVDKVDTLWTRAVKYIKNNFDMHKEYEVKGIDMHILDSSNSRIVVGKKCRIRSGWHGVDEKDLYVISAEHDLANPENDTYKIGIPTSDREAMNKTLTGQTTSSSTKSTNNAASAASGINQISSWLENYFSENEGWLELHNKFRNEVVSENGMFRTRFEQDEEHISLLAQKIFGVAGSDDVDNQDAGWILIPKPPYRKSGNGVEDYYESSSSDNTTYKIPNEHNWYVKGSDGKYTKSNQDTRVTQAQVNDPNVNFYIMRLASRYAGLEVGKSGIKGRVDGNYERSTANSSWIEVNEESILALTGHLWVDEDGHVHVTAGNGMRSDSHAEATTPQWIQVKTTQYTDSNGHDVSPVAKHWYEHALNEDKSWKGQGQADALTNDSYYTPSTDTTVDRSKHYYYKSYVNESFISQFGVYDEDNLTAGIIAKTVNHPTYHKIKMEDVNNAIIRHQSPKSQGWYEYDERTGMYGISLNEGDPSWTDYYKGIGYYYVVNNMENYTAIMGDHIVVGGKLDDNGDPRIFYGVNKETQSRIHKYIDNNNLDGTITEVASDVLYAHAVFTNYLNVYAEKLLGSKNGDYDYVVVKAAGQTDERIPIEHDWYELVEGEYILSTDEECVTSKAYYIPNITKRITSFIAGEDGIVGSIKKVQADVILAQTWIAAYDDGVEMITGHIREDENGNLVIDAGTGLKTGYTVQVNDPDHPTYIKVAKSQYAGKNPSAQGWYEPQLNNAGEWISGQYRASTDTTADTNKQYFIKSTIRENYIAEYGVYSEGNLTAGVIAQMVNHPKYDPIKPSEHQGANPKAEGWYELITSGDNKGQYGQTQDTYIHAGKVYYERSEHASSETDIKGEYIVIGKTEGYSGLDADQKAKVDKWLRDHPHLDGTVTEIASDVVTINTLIAKYIEADEITANTSLSTDSIDFNNGMCFGTLEFWTSSGYPSCETVIDDDQIDVHNVHCGALIISSSGDDVIFGDGNTSEGAADADPADIVVGFGTPTTSGDDVSIPYLTAGDSGTYDTDKKITFTKPASLGTVTWSSGTNGGTLTAKTVGGADFLVGTVGHFSPSGWQEAQAMQSCAYLDTETTGYSQVYGITYTAKDGSNNDIQRKTMLFKTPKNRYPDAVSTIKTWSTPGTTDSGTIPLGYSDSTKVYARYRTEAQYDADSGDTDCGGVTITSPSRGEVRTYANFNSTDYTSGEIDLGNSGGSVTVYGEKKMDGDSSWESAAYGITVKASAMSWSDLEIDENGGKKTSTSVGINGSIVLVPYVKINGERKSGDSCTVSGPSLSSISLTYTGTTTEGEGDDAVTYYNFRTTTAKTSGGTFWY